MLMKGRWSINYLILLIDGTLKRNERMKWVCANTAEKCQNVEICSIINWLCNYREGEREREERIEAIETNCHGDNFSRFTSCKFMDHLFHSVVLVLLSIYFPPVHFKCCSNWGWGREVKESWAWSIYYANCCAIWENSLHFWSHLVSQSVAWIGKLKAHRSR